MGKRPRTPVLPPHGNAPLGSVIRVRRQLQGIPLAKFAAILGNYDRSFISHIENNTANPSPELLNKIAQVLDVSVNSLQNTSREDFELLLVQLQAQSMEELAKQQIKTANMQRRTAEIQIKMYEQQTKLIKERTKIIEEQTEIIKSNVTPDLELLASLGLDTVVEAHQLLKLVQSHGYKGAKQQEISRISKLLQRLFSRQEKGFEGK